MTPNINVNVPGSSPSNPAASTMFAGAPNTLGALVSQHRLLELSRFGLRGYDLAQHMLTQQGAVSKLLGKCFKVLYVDIHDTRFTLFLKFLKNSFFNLLTKKINKKSCIHGQLMQHVIGLKIKINHS